MIITGIGALVWAAGGLGLASIGLMALAIFSPGVIHHLF
jgi:hypothetical protein